MLVAAIVGDGEIRSGEPEIVSDDALVRRVESLLPGVLDDAVLPDAVVPLSSMPLTGRTSKLDRAAIRALVAAGLHL